MLWLSFLLNSSKRHGLFPSRSVLAGRNYRINYVASASGAPSFCLPQFGRYMSNRGSKLAPPDPLSSKYFGRWE